MPRPTYFSYDPRYVSISTAQQRLALNEINDCTVIATSAAADLDYAQAHAALAALGRKHRKGTRTENVLKVLADAGKTVQPVSPTHFLAQYPGRHSELKHVTTHHPDRFPEVWPKDKTYLLLCSRHILTVKNGVNCDWTRSRARRVLRIWEVRS